jgi:hypothetical protein
VKDSAAKRREGALRLPADFAFGLNQYLTTQPSSDAEAKMQRFHLAVAEAILKAAIASGVSEMSSFHFASMRIEVNSARLQFNPLPPGAPARLGSSGDAGRSVICMTLHADPESMLRFWRLITAREWVVKNKLVSIGYRGASGHPAWMFPPSPLWNADETFQSLPRGSEQYLELTVEGD